MRSLIPATMESLSPDALELQQVLRARGMSDVADELLLAKAEPGVVGVKLRGSVSGGDPDILYAQYPVDHPYASGKAINLGVATIAPAGNAQADIVTAGFSTLTILARIGNATTPATAPADITAIVLPYEDDDTTLLATQLAPDFVPRAAVLVGNAAAIEQRWILGGRSKVAARLTNNNVGALQGGTVIYFLQK